MNRGQYVKGHTGWNKGQPLTEEHRAAISASNKGKVRTEEVREKLSKAKKGVYVGIKSHSYRHGMCRTRFYGIWTDMKTRCYNPKNKRYHRYHGRGVEVLWKSFGDFKEDMYPPYLSHVVEFGEKETTIDRIDNSGHYSKENCQWATWKEQRENKG